MPGGKMDVAAAASVAAKSQFKERVDDQASRNSADKTADTRERDDNRAVNRSNRELRAQKIAAERGGVDIQV